VEVAKKKELVTPGNGSSDAKRFVCCESGQKDISAFGIMMLDVLGPNSI